MSEGIANKNKREELGITDYPKNTSNPFVEQALEEIKWKTKTQTLKSKDGSNQKYIVGNDGEVDGHAIFVRQIEVEEDKFAKVFLTQFDGFWELKPSAIRVFGYIINNLKPNEDRVYVDFDECLKYTKYSNKRMLFTGFASLISCNMLARSNAFNVYYINPLMFFNGSRVTFAKSLIKIKNKVKILNPNQTSLLDQPGVVDNNDFLKQ